MAYTQTGQPLAVISPLPADTLLLVGMKMIEGISRLYHMTLDVMVEDGKTVSFDALLGQPIAVQLDMGGGASRYFHGICNRVGQGDHDEGFTHYYLDVVPKMWLLTKTAHSRIFKHMKLTDVINQVTSAAGITDIDVSGFSGDEQREYWTQYRESDFNFLTRLMEELGAYYYFTHEQSKHTLVVADNSSNNPTLPNQPTATFTDLQNLPGAIITTLRKDQEICSTKVTLFDYNFEGPANPSANAQIVPSVAAGPVTHNLSGAWSSTTNNVYDYPGDFAWRADEIDPDSGGAITGSVQIPDGTSVVKVRMGAEAVRAVQLHGTSNATDFTSGYQFTVQSNFSYSSTAPAFDGGYVLTSVEHSARLQGPGQGNSYDYQNEFTCIPVKLAYRPERSTPRPVIHGTQTAVVVGLSSDSTDDIFVDGYGRVKVNFPWDKESTPTPSRWARVGTVWGGQGWGAIHIPRVGMEVVISFEEGDPERPLIVGCVYNGQNPPPYKLPDKKTQSGIKSRSSPQGGAQNFNELRFEDKKDSEEIYFHAEKDFNRVVENNDTLKVGFEKMDKGDQTIEIFNNQSLTVGAGKAQADKGDQTITVFNDQKVTIGDPTASDGSQTVSIYKDRKVTLQTGNDSLEVQQGNRDVKIDMGNDTLTISMGNQSTKIDMGSSTTEAMQSITLKVGQNSIVIDQTGVTINALQIKLDAQLTAAISSQLQTQLGSQLQTQVQGTMVQVSGNAMTQISGAITMIG
jgi:type VI secretion system secreted protein VgrG